MDRGIGRNGSYFSLYKLMLFFSEESWLGASIKDRLALFGKNHKMKDSASDLIKHMII